MEKEVRGPKRKYRVKFIFTFVLLSVLTIGFLIGRFYLNKENIKLKSLCSVSRIDNDDIDKRIHEINKDIEDREYLYNQYLNDKEEAEKLKKEYFLVISDLENKIMNGESDMKIAYLTFDDGPYLLSSSFLDVLDEYGVPATFFYLMKGYENGYSNEDYAYDQTYRRIINSGHTLGNHTATHKLGKNGIYSSVDAFMYDLILNRNFIENRYGYITDVMRFPGGSNTSSLKYALIDEIHKIGYNYVDWNSATGDGGGVLSVESFRDNVLYNTGDRKILVVLMHDYSYNTLLALPEIIEGLRNQGYTFFPLFHDSIMTK